MRKLMGRSKWGIVLLVLFIALPIARVDAQVRQSKAIPSSSPQISEESSEFTLVDPRVALRNIEEVGERGDMAKIGELIKAYKENDARPDGYGPSIQITTVQTLAKLKSRESADFLIGQLTATDDITLKDEITYALGEIGEAKALNELNVYLNRLLENEPEEELIKFQWQMYVDRVKEAIEKITSR